MRSSRRAFVAGSLALGALAPQSGRAQTASRRPQPAGGSALILTGGVNRGAYQAGAIAGLAEKAGIPDGVPLPYDLVAGSSIGALNAYYVAVAQYGRMRQVWRDIAGLPLFSLKRRDRSVTEPSSGVGTRIYAAASLAFGMASHEKGVVDPSTIEALLNREVDVDAPVHIPLYFTATNLTHKRTEIFVLRGTGADGEARQQRLDPFLAGRKNLVLHPLNKPDIRLALLASAALPVIFDPVRIPSINEPGKTDEFIDGGMADNVPISVAKRSVSNIDIIAVDPPVALEEEVEYNNAVEIGAAVFGVMQARIIQQSVRLAYAESLLAAGVASPADELQDEEVPLRIRYLRPEKALPGALGDFSDRASLDAMQEIGRADALRGWLEFSPTRIFGQ